MKSFNRLKLWLKKGKFKKTSPKKTKMPCIDAVRDCLSDFDLDLDGLKGVHKHIIETTIKNKVFRNGTINGLKIVAIDGVELFESSKKHCDKCLTRVQKGGAIHYFHRSVVCLTVGSDSLIYKNLIKKEN